MADSLVLANTIELLGAEGGVPSQIPACAGAIFLLADDGSYDLGAHQPTTDFVASLILDGERPFGRRSSNRTITLPVKIVSPTGDRRILAAAREVLEQAVDQDTWTLTWTRDPGTGTRLPLVLDCFRAQPSKPLYNPLTEQQGVMWVTLSIPALPYGRSDTQYTPAFTGAVPQTPTPPPPPSPVVLDNYSTISGPQFTQSTQCVVGPFTACWDPDSFGDPGGQTSQLSYSSKFTSPLNLTSMSSLQMWLGLGSRYYPFLEYPGRIHGTGVSVTLTDTNGATISMSRDNLRLPVTPVAQAPVFTRVSIPFPAVSATFLYSSVASYSLTVTNRRDRGIHRLQWVTAFIDALTAYPSTQTASPVTRGNLYTLYGLQGTARSPISLSFQQPPSPGTPTTITATGVSTYTVPGGTAWLKVEAIGGGGAGGTRTTSGVGGGGGGGEYAREDIFPAAAGQVIPYTVGVGGTPGATPVDGAATTFGPGPSGTLVVQAGGGQSAAQNSIAGGTCLPVSTNSVHYPGGAGRTASGSVGGGGGGSGGTSSPGNTPVGTSADLFTTAGVNTWTAPAGVTQIYAECWGAGGSGATGGPSTNGGGGGGGEYVASFLNVTPGTLYTFGVGTGGSAVSGSAVNGNAGTSTVFTGDNGAITAHGGAGGLSRASGGGGAGGTGSGGVHFNGGAGGSASPYSGGGGSSAGAATTGNAGNGYGGPGAAPADGGAGGAGSGATGNNGTAGSAPGGGGGGTFSNVTSGAGATGKVRLTYPGGAPTNNGAAAVSGGGAGGAGGGSAGTAGSAGSQPGGGGGGGDSSGTTVAGGAGGNGKLIITPYASAPFKQLIVHRPPLGAVKTFQPLVSVGGGGDAPDGTHEYRMPQPVTGLNADFGGTYTVYLIASSLSGSGARNIQVTVNQYEYSGGPKYTASTAVVSITPAQVVNGIITAGVLTLPVKNLAADNTGAYYTVTPFSSNSADRFYDCIFLDTMGQSVIVNQSGTSYINYFVDEPQPNATLGPYVLGSNGGRPNAVSVLDNAIVSGGAIAVEPADGDNSLFTYSADAQAPVISVSSYARWYFDRTQ